MRTLVRTLIALVFAATSFIYGALPPISISVSDSSGKTTYKGVTNASGTFATGTLEPGNYLVRFGVATAPKESGYTLVLSSGKKKVSANAIAAEKLIGGGVAMKIDVGRGMNITGQVAPQNKNSAPIGHNGKPMVWIGPKIGSNLAPHWAESDSAEAKEVETGNGLNQKNIQDRQNQGITPYDQIMSKTGL
jgi:hypothetical protein